MLCPNCEKEIANNVVQCSHCSCRFPVKEPPRPQVIPLQPKPVVPRQTQQEPAAKPIITPFPASEIRQQGNAKNATSNSISGKNCPNCKNEISETATFCKYCGTKIIETVTTTQENIKICPSCNKEISQTATFCKWCGAKNA